MIQWCFAYNCTNYSRYLSLYYQDMCNLEMEHPDAHQSYSIQYLGDGRFSIQMSSDNPFHKITVDQCIGETVTKTPELQVGTKALASSMQLCSNTILQQNAGQHLYVI